MKLRGKWVVEPLVFRVGVLIAGTLVLASMCGGCLIIPTIPHNAAGFGRTYRFVDEKSRPIKSGLLVMESKYEFGVQSMFNCYPIVDGLARVPGKVAVRYGYSGGFSTIFLYAGRFLNPALTMLVPLAPGRAALGSATEGGLGLRVLFVRDLGTPPETIHLVPQAPHQERYDLELLETGLKVTLEEGMREDKAAAKQALAYIAKRLTQLPPAGPAVPSLVEALRDKDWRLRLACAQALGRIGPAAKAAIPALTKALKDQSKDVRKAAAEALRKIQAAPATRKAKPFD